MIARAVGAVAVGALAIGALPIRRLVIGRVAMRSGEFNSHASKNLIVTRLGAADASVCDSRKLPGSNVHRKIST
jgi:hypothetical protein